MSEPKSWDEVNGTKHINAADLLAAVEAERDALREADARLREWLIHERDLCEATGDKAGWIAYQRALDKRGQLERDRLAKHGGTDD